MQIVDPLNVGIAKRAFRSSRHCGDHGGVWRAEGRLFVALADGLGHGAEAEVAARRAIDFVEGHLGLPFGDIFREADSRLRDTRGAALGIAVFDPQAMALRYAGIGNIRAALVGSRVQGFGNNSGIVGGGDPRPSEGCLDVRRGDLLALWSDGLPESLALAPFRRRRGLKMQAVVDQLLSEWGHRDDDASVIVVRLEPGLVAQKDG